MTHCRAKKSLSSTVDASLEVICSNPKARWLAKANTSSTYGIVAGRQLKHGTKGQCDAPQKSARRMAPLTILKNWNGD